MFRLSAKEPSGNMGTLTVLQRLNRYTFAVEVAVMREGVNSNRWDYRNLDKYWNTFIG